jgi:membrane protease YdiL (CAAX protease family)
VLLALLGISLVSGISRNLPLVGGGRRIAGYVVIMAFEWILLAFIWFGVSRCGLTLKDLIAGSWARPLAILRDIGIAVAFLVISGIILNGIGHVLKTVPNQAIRNVLPRTPIETVVYLLVALTAGFCEEVFFRGYLQRQFTALTDSIAGGIVLQGIAFGASHGYQGWKWMLLISVFGTLFGLLAYWRRSLRPGMVAHFVQDGIAGVLARHFLR